MNYLPENLRSERILFRKLEENDFKAWLPYYEDTESTRYSSVYQGSSEEKCKTLFSTIFDRYENGNGLMALVSQSSGKLVGLCGLLKQLIDGEDVIEIGYHILPAERRKGYASEAAIRIKEHAFEHKLADSLVSIINEKNENSKKVAMKNGMTLEKKYTWREQPVEVYRIDSRDGAGVTN